MGVMIAYNYTSNTVDFTHIFGVMFANCVIMLLCLLASRAFTIHFMMWKIRISDWLALIC